MRVADDAEAVSFGTPHQFTGARVSDPGATLLGRQLSARGGRLAYGLAGTNLLRLPDAGGETPTGYG